MWKKLSLVLVVGLMAAFIFLRESRPSSSDPRIIPDVPRDAIPPLDNPEYLSISEISNQLTNDDVLLITLFGSQKFAYPIRIMNWHEIVNDSVDELRFVATYCPLCRSGIVFSRELEGKTLSFGNTGSLFESVMVLYDRETDSLWAQINGTALTGELTGKKLEVLPSTMLTFAEIKETYPDTLILSFNTEYSRDYTQDPFSSYEESGGKPSFPVSTFDDRLTPKTRIIGLEFDGESRAYPITSDAPSELIDEVGEKKVRIKFNLEDLTATAFDAETGDPLPQTNTFWFGWSVTRPESEVFGYR